MWTSRPVLWANVTAVVSLVITATFASAAAADAQLPPPMSEDSDPPIATDGEYSTDNQLVPPSATDPIPDPADGDGENAPMPDVSPPSQAPAAPAGAEDSLPASDNPDLMPAAQRGGGYVNWEAEFPDTQLRQSVQNALGLSGPELATVTPDRLAEVTGLNLRDTEFSNGKGLQLLTGLTWLDLTGTRVNSLDLRQNTKLEDVHLSGTPICPTVSFTRAGTTQQFDIGNCGSSEGMPRVATGAYILDGSRHTYSYSRGSGSTSYFAVNDSAVGRPVEFQAIERGTRSRYLYDNGIEREEVRTIDAVGVIRHTVTLRNVGTTPVTTDAFQTIDTELDGVDSVDIFSDGHGGAYISNGSVTFYFLPLSDNMTAYAADWGPENATEFRERRIDTNRATALAGLPAGQQLTSSVDSALVYLVGIQELPPGASLRMVFQGSMHRMSDPKMARIDFVLTTADGDEVVHSVSREGADGIEWDFSTYPDMPIGYLLDPTRPSATRLVFGATGQLTTALVYVIPAITPEPQAPQTPQTPTPAPAEVPIKSSAAGTTVVPQPITTLANTGANTVATLLSAATLGVAGLLLVVRRMRS